MKTSQNITLKFLFWVTGPFSTKTNFIFVSCNSKNINIYWKILYWTYQQKNVTMIPNFSDIKVLVFRKAFLLNFSDLMPKFVKMLISKILLSKNVWEFRPIQNKLLHCNMEHVHWEGYPETFLGGVKCTLVFLV